ncbi:Thermoresistant gluconokinase [Kluyvera cryocrescens]|uniref:Gluconokinase n=1 Tax=Kluyvera cryocrescens TaxID=580 RepID=A0A485BGM9_KLUCR|nr:Thermoresistant gluconokinase [Kluyvera cryocrescens]
MAGQCIILMGVSGTGKTTVGLALSQALGAKFIDGDDLHPRQNIIKMAAGQPLEDSDRQPWLERIGDVIFSLGQKNESGVLVCSALKKHYRDQLREGNPCLRFLWLTGDYDCILQRMQARKGTLCRKRCSRSQFAALEAPDANEPDIQPVDVSSDVSTYRRPFVNPFSPPTPTGSSGMIIDTLTRAEKNAFYPAVIRKALRAVIQQSRTRCRRKIHRRRR